MVLLITEESHRENLIRRPTRQRLYFPDAGSRAALLESVVLSKRSQACRYPNTSFSASAKRTYCGEELYACAETRNTRWGNFGQGKIGNSTRYFSNITSCKGST